MILLRISSSETFRATITSFENWWRAANSSTISATRAISDRLLAMRISQEADNPACGETEDPVFITATGVPSGHIVAHTIARCAPRVIAAGPRPTAGSGGPAGRWGSPQSRNDRSPRGSLVVPEGWGKTAR